MFLTRTRACCPRQQVRGGRRERVGVRGRRRSNSLLPQTPNPQRKNKTKKNKGKQTRFFLEKERFEFRRGSTPSQNRKLARDLDVSPPKEKKKKRKEKTTTVFGSEFWEPWKLVWSLKGGKERRKRSNPPSNWKLLLGFGLLLSGFVFCFSFFERRRRWEQNKFWI